MSLLAPRTALCDASLRTDLGSAYEAHVMAHSGDATLALGYPETGWLNVMRDRAQRTLDGHLSDLTHRMLAMLADPAKATASFQEGFLALHDQAGRHAYPLAWTLLDEHHAIAGMTSGYTLSCFDFGMIRAMEDEALEDTQMRGFVDAMLLRLRAGVDTKL
jgi:hypothetical protein